MVNQVSNDAGLKQAVDLSQDYCPPLAIPCEEPPMTYTDCMIDFETLGLSSASAVTQLGYVFFNRDETEAAVMPGHNIKIDIGKQLIDGRKVLPSTWKWCQKQDNFTQAQTVQDIFKQHNEMVTSYDQ